MYVCYAHGWNSHDRLCPSCFVEHTWSGTNATGTLVIEDSDKMESLLEEIETLRAQLAIARDALIKVDTEQDNWSYQEYEEMHEVKITVKKALAQLSVEPKKVGK